MFIQLYILSFLKISNQYQYSFGLQLLIHLRSFFFHNYIQTAIHSEKPRFRYMVTVMIKLSYYVIQNG